MIGRPRKPLPRPRRVDVTRRLLESAACDRPKAFRHNSANVGSYPVAPDGAPLAPHVENGPFGNNEKVLAHELYGDEKIPLGPEPSMAWLAPLSLSNVL